MQPLFSPGCLCLERDLSIPDGLLACEVPSGLPVNRDSSTAGFDGSLSGCLAWPLTPCFPELVAFLHGQGASVHGCTPAALVELT